MDQRQNARPHLHRKPTCRHRPKNPASAIRRPPPSSTIIEKYIAEKKHLATKHQVFYSWIYSNHRYPSVAFEIRIQACLKFSNRLLFVPLIPHPSIYLKLKKHFYIIKNKLEFHKIINNNQTYLYYFSQSVIVSIRSVSFRQPYQPSYMDTFYATDQSHHPLRLHRRHWFRPCRLCCR